MLLIYTTKITRRQSYIFDLIFKELLKVEYAFTVSVDEFKSFVGPKINYSKHPIKDEIFFSAHDLLFETGINDEPLSIIDFEGHKAFFPVYERHAVLPFDPFAASFYLVTRYEEYLPFIEDEFGRFSPKNSLAYQYGFLDKPLVNIWSLKIAKIIKDKFPTLIFPAKHFKFQPTFDIDLAYSFRMKGPIRTIGGYIKSMIKLDFEEIKERTKVLLRIKKDPFDTYDLIRKIHDKFNLEPIFFILFSQYSQFDKNISTDNRRFQSLVKFMDDYAEVGIHPSFASNTDDEKLRKEIKNLSTVLHSEITKSRQHFLKLNLPYTYRNLLLNDITDDYSMGYASETGFRASICYSFKFYDLDLDRETNLRVHPFTLMDGTLRDYKRITVKQALTEIFHLIDEVKAVNGTFISLWHNESMSNEKRWKGWHVMYEEMVKYAMKND